MVGKIERVPLRDMWKHEAYDFTTWVQDNIDVLNEELGLSLSNPEREQAAGSFSVDLVAEDDAGNPVIIENQLEKSNHDHLGKVITYLTAIGAKTAIWIVSDPRPEHVVAVAWLNESSSANFYFIKVEGIKIGDSEPAPLLTLIVGPSEESRFVGEKKKELAERFTIRYEFWKQLLKTAKEKTKIHAQISPNQHGWMGAAAGKRGLSFNYVIRQHDGKVELYIDRGKDSEDENKKIFDDFYSNKAEIEHVFGDLLNWERLDTKRACRISRSITDGGYRDPTKWDEIHEAMIDAMCRLDKSLRPFIKKLKLR